MYKGKAHEKKVHMKLDIIISFTDVSLYICLSSVILSSRYTIFFSILFTCMSYIYIVPVFLSQYAN